MPMNTMLLTTSEIDAHITMREVLDICDRTFADMGLGRTINPAKPGLHCSPYIHRMLGTFPNGMVRISPGAFNTQEELDTLIDALDQIAG